MLRLSIRQRLNGARLGLYMCYACRARVHYVPAVDQCAVVPRAAADQLCYSPCHVYQQGWVTLWGCALWLAGTHILHSDCASSRPTMVALLVASKPRSYEHAISDARAHVHAMRLVPWLVWPRVPSSHVARPAHSYLGLGVPSPVPSRSYTRPVPPVQFVLMIRRLKPKTSLRNGPEACRAAFESLTNVCSQRSHLSQPRTAHALYMHCSCTCTVHALHTHCTCPVLALYMHAHRCARADPRACDGRCPLRAGRTLAGCY